MRDPNRIEPILQRIKEVWTKHPDLRLGQLILNLSNYNPNPAGDLYYLEDDALMERFEMVYKETHATKQSP